MSIEQRIRKAEQALNMGRKPLIINRIWFGGEPVPPEQRRGNIISRYIAYEALQTQQEGESGHEH